MQYVFGFHSLREMAPNVPPKCKGMKKDSTGICHTSLRSCRARNGSDSIHTSCFSCLSEPSLVRSVCWCKHYLGSGALLGVCYGLGSGPSSEEMLLKRTSALLSSALRGLDEVDLESRKKVMESCGEACASFRL